MIRPLRNRLFAKLIPRYIGDESRLNLILVDKKKHYEGVRWGVVEAVGPDITTVVCGDVVLFRGDAGESFGQDEHGTNDGTDWRRLRISDVLAVKEIEREPITVEG